jgi:hypothetical protein
MGFSSSHWVDAHQNILVTGPTGIGNYVELGVMVRNGHPLQQEGQMAVK